MSDKVFKMSFDIEAGHFEEVWLYDAFSSLVCLQNLLMISLGISRTRWTTYQERASADFVYSSDEATIEACRQDLKASPDAMVFSISFSLHTGIDGNPASSEKKFHENMWMLWY